MSDDSPEYRDAVEYEDAKMHTRELLANKSGKPFFKYLLKSLDVGILPAQGLDGLLLHNQLGYLRAGNELLKMLSEVDTKMAGIILAEIAKERNDELYKDYRKPSDGNDSGD